MKYFLIIYDFAFNYPDLFNSMDVNAMFWPNGMLGWNESKNGAKTPNWGSANVIPYVICKDSTPTQEMTDAANDSAASWNAANPNNQTGDMQLIFDEGEKDLIKAQLDARQVEIINSFEGV